jgi:hypothetical protein
LRICGDSPEKFTGPPEIFIATKSNPSEKNIFAIDYGTV